MYETVISGCYLSSFITGMTFPVGRSTPSFSDQLMFGLGLDDNSELPFCTEDNVAECLSYLNQVFVMMLLFAL